MNDKIEKIIADAMTGNDLTDEELEQIITKENIEYARSRINALLPLVDDDTPMGDL